MEIMLAAVVFAAAVSREDETKQYSDPLHKRKRNDHFYHWLETQRSLPPLAQLLLHLSSSSSSELEVWNVLAPCGCHQARALSWPDVTDGQARWTVHTGITPLLPLHTCPSLSHLWTEEQQDWLLTCSWLGTLGGTGDCESGQFGVRLGYAV